LISGFASPSGVTEEIDLRDISFGKKTKVSFHEDNNHLSGTLTVSLASDGFGGTMITDPMVGSGGHPVLAPPA
jgi:hypothetical protein